MKSDAPIIRRAAMMRLLQPKTVTCLALVATLLMATDGVAQQHPRGCCHATGCSTISNPNAELQKGVGESYTVTATGEVFFPPEQVGISPRPGRLYQWSEDGEFHRCGTNTLTQCLLVPRPGA
jgi:hypothetical protein